MDKDEYEPKPYLCPVCHWQIGEKYREHNQRVTRLRIYRRAIEPTRARPDASIPAHILFAALALNDGTVPCEHCGNAVGWYASENAMQEMFERRKARTFGLKEARDG